MTSPAPAEDSQTLIITRLLRAPRALVWKMFSDPYHLAQWWGPKGFANRVETLDFRTGGSWRHVMIGPDGHEYPTDDDIVDVTPPRRIIFRSAPADPKFFGDNPPPGFTKTLSFDEVEGGTRLTLVCSFDRPEHKDAVIRRGFVLGINESFDKLEAHLAPEMHKDIVSVPPGAEHFTIDRVIGAPRALVWKCYTEPQHLARFWGPRDTACAATVDLRVGGVWRTRWTYDKGGEYGYASVYLEIVAPERLHYRDAPLDWPGGLDGLPPAQLISTILLSDRPDGTNVHVHVRAASVALRDETVARGFAAMVATGNDRLEEYLASLREQGEA